MLAVWWMMVVLGCYVTTLQCRSCSWRMLLSAFNHGYTVLTLSFV